jgi:hypothetical protein
LPDAFQELPAIAQAVFDACQAWDEANRKWRAAQGA